MRTAKPFISGDKNATRRPRYDKMFWREHTSDETISEAIAICSFPMGKLTRLIDKAENHGYGKRVVGIRIINDTIELYMQQEE